MADNFGQVYFPGIQAIESLTLTDCSGIQPSRAYLTIFPQENIPPLSGDLVLIYNNHRIVFRNCYVDTATFTRNAGGFVIRLCILDERWKWSYGQITGRYNIRLPNNFVNKDHEKTPQELAKLCFEAMGVADFDVSALPNDSRPDVDWVAANPAQELANICDDLGCRIIIRRSDGMKIIVVTGQGGDLPDNNLYPVQDDGGGFDPKNLPDFLEVRTGPIEVQAQLKLAPIGRDIDQNWKYVPNLSYCPTPIDIGKPGYKLGFGFGTQVPSFSEVDGTRETLPDGSAISPRELALQWLYRAWRISTHTSVTKGKKVKGQPALWIDGIDMYVTRKQIIQSDKLVQCWTDERGEVHKRPAYMCGRFESTKEFQTDQNYPDGTRIDYQAKTIFDPEERASFSVHFDPIDTDRSVIVTSKQMRIFTNDRDNPGLDGSFPSAYDFATLRYVSAIQIRDIETWQPIVYTRRRSLGRGSDSTNVLIINRPDIQPWIINLYKNNGSFASSSNNYNEVDKQCEFYLDQIQRTLEDIASGTRVYIGLYPIDMDGAIQQVQYSVGPSGSDTIASRGSEHNFVTPSYAERRMRDANVSAEGRGSLLKEIADRREATKGTFNTL